MNPANPPAINPFLAIAILIWIIFWNILALWRAAKHHQKKWFFAIIVINVVFPGGTIGILEIVYLFAFAKEKLTLKELKSMLRLGSKST